MYTELTKGFLNGTVICYVTNVQLIIIIIILIITQIPNLSYNI